MKRAPLFVLAGTAVGLAGILSFHTRPAASAALGTPASHALPGKPTAAAGTGSPAASSATAGPASSATAGPAAPAYRRSAVGATEQYGYGYLAVRVILRGNRIVNVTVPVIQTAEQYSQQLAMQVIPSLRSEVLAGQTANISAVSGATYTSQAYATSLQAALDKLQFR